jgi:hypothetical protein
MENMEPKPKRKTLKEIMKLIEGLLYGISLILACLAYLFCGVQLFDILVLVLVLLMAINLMLKNKLT